jgi:hypothetical protein
MNMRNKNRGSAELEIFIWFILFVLFLGGSALFNYLGCKSQWERSGLQCDWRPIQGCMVQLPDGRWLPSSKIREIDINPKPE